MTAPIVKIERLELGPMDNFVYLAGDAAAGECFVIDPAWDAAAILEAARRLGLRVVGAALTHGHFDHSNALADLLAQVDAPFYVRPEDSEDFSAFRKNLEPTEDGRELPIGGLRMRCLHTPGHTPGGQCLLLEGNLFTGDTLFVGCCGRTDLPGSDPAKMCASLRAIGSLPPETIILPGHHYGKTKSTTVGEQRRTNPYLRAALSGSPEEAARFLS